MKKTTFLVAMVVIAIVGATFVRFQGRYDCTSVEKYDLIKDECYFDCNSDADCKKITKQRDAELDKAFAGSKSKVAGAKPTSAKDLDPSGSSLYTRATTNSETSGTVYTVTPTGLQPTLSSAKHKELWELANRLMGSSTVQKRLLSFEVFDDNNNDVGASVWRSDNPDKWHMSVNEAFADNKVDLIRTIIHEYGHIITLSGDQVTEVEGACPRLELSEGCGTQKSYINNFNSQFWNTYGIAPGKAGELSESEAADLYASYPRSFVSEYASTNITEDMAESFADFVVKAKPQSNAIKDQKVKFFYQYPEFVSLRNNIRAVAAQEKL